MKLPKFATCNLQLATKRGFTLIELLVVIAVLGVLAVVLLIAIDPIEKINQATDSNAKSSVSQVSAALLNWQTSNSGSVVPLNGTLANSSCASGYTTWGGCLTGTGELKTMPSNIDGSATANKNYNPGATDFSLSVLLVSKTEKAKAACAVGTPTAWWAYRTSAGTTGYSCTASATTLPAP